MKSQGGGASVVHLRLGGAEKLNSLPNDQIMKPCDTLKVPLEQKCVWLTCRGNDEYFALT